MEARRQREAQAQAAKRRSESLEDAEARRQQDAPAKAAKHRSESLEDAEARRLQDSRAKAAKHQSESLEDSEARRQREARAQKRYIVYKVVYISVYTIDDFLFKFRKRNSRKEEVKRKLK